MTAFNCVWHPSPRDLVLSSCDVHVFCASLDQPAAIVQQLAQTLSADERIRVERFYFERDKKRFMIGRGILRRLLARYLEIEPSQLEFCYGDKGKPALAKPFSESRLRFNLSHSQDLALYAFVREREIGVDIEHIRFLSDTEAIAARFFSERENAMFRALPPNQKQAAFFNCWTCKEAYLKAIGDGLAFPLDQLDVSLSPSEPAQIYAIKGERATTQWSVHKLSPAPNYVAALVVEGQDCDLKCWQWHY